MGITENYWDKHPEHALVFDEEFVKMKDSSKIMWSIYMLVDPRSDISMEPDQDKKLEYIKKYYDFDPDEYTEIIEQYINLIPEVEIVYNKMLLDLKSTVDMISETKLGAGDLKNAKLKIDALANGHKIIDELIKRKKAIVASRSTEAVAAAARGGYTPSRAEQGLIGSNAKK